MCSLVFLCGHLPKVCPSYFYVDIYWIWEKEHAGMDTCNNVWHNVDGSNQNAIYGFLILEHILHACMHGRLYSLFSKQKCNLWILNDMRVLS